MSALEGKTCLVTGASGFLGGWVAQRLSESGARVRCLVRPTSNRSHLATFGPELASGDVTDLPSLRRAVADADLVFHVAGLIKTLRPEDYVRVNHLGTINLLEAMRERGGVERVVLVSSQAAVGPSAPGRPVDEASPCRPVSPYGKSKLAGEVAARAYTSELPITVVRPPSIYGPRDRETLQIIQIAARGLRPVLRFPGEISAVHAADLADAILLAAVHPRAVGQTYFVAGDEIPSPNELMEIIAEVVGGRHVPLPLPAPAIRAAGRLAERVRDLTGLPLIFDQWKAEEIVTGFWACSNRRARSDLGWSPRYTLRSGLEDTVRWYRDHQWI